MSRPIADYALLGDCHSGALVSTDGSIDWWCAPRFDSRSVFARLLDSDAGHFAIRPVADFTVQREYVPDTMVLRTTFRTASGTLCVTDALALETGARGHDIGLRSPHIVLRVAEVLSGRVELIVEFAPRPEYGLVFPALRRVRGGVRTVGGADTLLLTSYLDLQIDGATAGIRVTLEECERTAFALQHKVGLARADFDAVDPAALLEDTVAGWRSWAAEHRGYQGPYRDAVARSALVLQALTYQPTGAVVAAPTTSLPEILGGEANWDYRFCWLRDASLTLRALWIAACPDEASRFFDWMASAVGRQPDRHVQIMFGVEGERDLTERELDHLAGYGASRPVRVGNDAWRQRQLDVMGEVLEAAHVMRDRLTLQPATAAFLCDLADRAAASWEQTDAGIWEGREGERHYTSSKLMCWVALDRAVKLSGQLGEGARPDEWAAARDKLKTTILEHAYSDELGAYAGAFGSDHMDASVLLMPIMGLVTADEERMLATIHAIDDQLRFTSCVWPSAWSTSSSKKRCNVAALRPAEHHTIPPVLSAVERLVGLLDVDSDRYEPVQAALVEVVDYDALDDSSHAVPGDPQQPSDRGLGHLLRQPGHHVPEVACVARSRTRPWHCFEVHAAVAAAQAAQLALDHTAVGAQVEVAPALDPAVVDLQAAAGLSATRAHPTPAPQSYRHDHPLGAERDVSDGCSGQAEHPLECGLDAHVVLL